MTILNITQILLIIAMNHRFGRKYLHLTSPLHKIILVTFGLALSLLFSTIVISNDMAYSQTAKRPAAHGVEITTPKQGDKISINIDNFTMNGRSLDNSKSDCQVLVILNDLKPYQTAVANGPNGDDDFSQWFYALSPDTKLKIGTNKITAKIDCKKPLDALRYDAVSITGTTAYNSDVDKKVNNAKKASTQQNGSLQVDNLAVNNASKIQELDTNVNNNNTLSHSQFDTPSTIVEQQDRIFSDAADIYSDKKMTVPPGVKYLVVLIPNEGHESENQPKNQLPLTNQPYLPQNAVIGKDTKIIWLNADVGHRHKISINDSSSQKIFESEFFNYNKASNPVRLNKTGTYLYWESNVSKEVPDFVMTGTITVTSQNQNVLAESQNKQEIVGTFMIPAMFLDKYRSEFIKMGFTVDSDFSYKDLRGGQKGTGPEQTLITWGTSETDIGKVTTQLQKITSTLPYS
jgi:hypothetical protein